MLHARPRSIATPNCSCTDHAEHTDRAARIQSVIRKVWEMFLLCCGDRESRGSTRQHKGFALCRVFRVLSVLRDRAFFFGALAVETPAPVPGNQRLLQ